MPKSHEIILNAAQLEEERQKRLARLDRVAAGKEEPDNEQRFLAHYYESPTPTYVWTITCNDIVLTDYNKAGEKFSGPNIKDLLGRSYRWVYRDAPVVVLSMEACARDKKTINRYLKLPLRTQPAGQHLDATWVFIPPDVVIFHAQDISDKVRVQELLENANQELEEANQELEERVAERTATLEKTIADLQRSETEKTAVLNGFRDVVIEYVDPDLNIIWTNLPLEESQGRPIQGEKCHEVVFGCSTPCKDCTAVKAIQTNKPQEGEVTWPDGTTFLVRSTPVFGEHGALQGVVHMGLDITARKRAEDDLRTSEARVKEQEQRLELALTSSKTGLWDWDLVNKTAIFNDIWAEMLGYTLSELSDSEDEWAAKLHPEDAALAFGAIQEHMAGNSDRFVVEHRMQTKSGEYRWFLGTGMVTDRNASGEPVRLTGTQIDIHNRKIAQLQLKESEKRLRRQQELMAKAEQMAMIGSWELDLATNEYIASDGLLRIFGMDAKAIHLNTVFEIIHPEDRAKVREKLEEAVKMDGVATTENRIIRQSDHEIRWLRVNGEAARDDDGKAVRMLGAAQDITESVNIQKELLHAKRLAEAANLTKSQFLANMSHEIRTPLNGVLGMLQLALDTPMDNEQRELLGTALESGRNLLRLINDILDFSKIEAGRMEMESGPVQVEKLISSVLAVFHQQAMVKNLDLRVFVAENTPAFVNLDAARLRQVLFNLVGNAIKFTAVGSVSITVQALEKNAKAGQVQLLFTVEDTGVGVPDNLQNDIFEPFTQADGSYTRKHQGAGLGLSIVRRLVELMGGTVALESSEGVGTAVHFTVLAGQCDETPHAEAEPAQTFLKPTESPLRILVCEDDSVNSAFLVKLLQRLGHKPVPAKNGKDGLQKLEDGGFDLALMDIQMPELDGVETTRLIRKDTSGRWNPDMPIIALTAYAMKGDREKFLAEGMNEYLSKPVDMGKLIEALKTYGKTETA